MRENVKLGRSGFGDQEILEALQASGALGWVRKQPLGLDTVIGEQGKGLSGGQKQTLAIARALCGSPPFIALDEPTSDLDPNTENAIVTRLKGLTADTTLVLVTHRPALLEAVDRIVVVEAGRVMIDGPKKDVFSKLQNVVDVRKQATGPTQ
ncbi:MAG: ATP-binding cassette domain-containing protein [Ahrensia sp.]|nr:ATP-binding cassette domain-containing protein [Ahrensia sp.]